MKALTGESGLDNAHAGRLRWLEKTGARTREAQLYRTRDVAFFLGLEDVLIVREKEFLTYKQADTYLPFCEFAYDVQLEGSL